MRSSVCCCDLNRHGVSPTHIRHMCHTTLYTRGCVTQVTYVKGLDMVLSLIMLHLCIVPCPRIFQYYYYILHVFIDYLVCVICVINWDFSKTNLNKTLPSNHFFSLYLFRHGETDTICNKNEWNMWFMQVKSLI